MALSDYQIGLLRTGVKLLERNIAKGQDIPASDLLDRLDWFWLRIFLNDIRLEEELKEGVEEADRLLIEAGKTLAGAHTDAADVEVNPPGETQLNTFKENLNKFHKLVANDQRFEAAAKLAGALAQLVEDEENSDQSDNG